MRKLLERLFKTPIEEHIGQSQIDAIVREVRRAVDSGSVKGSVYRYVVDHYEEDNDLSASDIKEIMRELEEAKAPESPQIAHIDGD